MAIGNLFLHIGHGKTGTSYIQSILARSADGLREAGISYPLPKNFRAASQGQISSGNREEFFSYKNNGTDSNLLFSSEALFRWFSARAKQPELEEKVRELSPGKLSVLLFIRDPVEHCCSGYQQSVKRHSNEELLSGYIVRYNMPAKVRVAIDFCANLGADITIHNYSAKKESIADITAQWLGIDPNILSAPRVDIVNRSMTRSEIALLLAVNRKYKGSSGKILADALCNKCSHIKADDIRPDVEEQTALWNRLEDDIEFVNSKVPAHARYNRERDIRPTADDVPEGLFTFTQEQLDVIGEQFATIWKKSSRFQGGRGGRKLG